MNLSVLTHDRFRSSLIFILLSIAVLSPLVLFGKERSLYVDRDNKGLQDGSFNHPYRTIEKALKQVKHSTVIYIAKGTYEENITLPKNVKLIGRKNIGDVVIKSKSVYRPTITMKDDSEINKITVVGGSHGVWVNKHAEARVVRCLIRDSHGDGIHVAPGTRSKTEEVYIDRSTIRDHERAGVYSESRSIVLLQSDIRNNHDGINFSKGVKAWLADSFINDNHGSGANIVLDGANFWSKNTSFRRNEREGVEINAFRESGVVHFERTKFVSNGRFGVAKVARSARAKFSQFVLERPMFEGNKFGTTSPWLRVGY